MRSQVIAALLAAAGLACSDGPTAGSAATPSAAVDPPQAASPPVPGAAGAAAPVQPPAATPPLAPPPAVARASVHEPGGTQPLSPDGETVVDPVSSFELELGGRLTDARLVLIDGADAHVPAAASREVGATTRFLLRPAAPLVPGSRYVLRVEGAATSDLHDAAGRAYAPRAFTLLVAGTPPPPEPKRRPKRRRR